MRSAHVLRRSGWSKELFPINTQVTIEAAPDRVDPSSCYLNTIRFANGSRMDRYGQYVKAPEGLKEVRGVLPTVAKSRAPRRPSGEPNISGDWAPEQVVMVDPRGTGGGLVPLSQIGTAKPGERGAGGGRRAGGAPAGPRRFGGAELTPFGEEMAAKFQQSDNPRFRCETTSIIFDWTFDGPVNRITQNRDSIVIEYGQMNLKRTVHMNMKSHPATVRPSRTGHSIGRWEGDTLVVESAGFNDRTWLDLSGHPHTEALRVTERFQRLDTGRMRLEMTFADPNTYSRPWTIGVDMQLMPDTELLESVCHENEKDRPRLVGRLEDDLAQKVTLAPHVLEQYVGSYFAGPLGKIQVVIHGGELALVLPGGEARHPAFAKSDQQFLVPTLGTPLQFVKNERGEVMRLRVTSVEGDIDAPRLTGAVGHAHH
jgi:hypothetical protein